MTTTHETLEVPQDQFIDQVIDVPVTWWHRSRKSQWQRLRAAMQVTTVMKQAKGSSGDPELEPGAQACAGTRKDRMTPWTTDVLRNSMVTKTEALEYIGAAASKCWWNDRASDDVDKDI